MAAILDVLMTSVAVVFGSALAPGHGSTMLVAAGVTVVAAVAVFVLAQSLLGSAGQPGAMPAKPGSWRDEPVVLPQSDPDAPGRARPRAPTAAVPAA